jgi:cell division protease FtsH
MSDSPPPDNRRPNPKAGPPERFQPKVFLIWLAIIAAIFLLMVGFPGGGGQTEELTIIEVLELIEEDRLERGIIKNVPGRGRDWFEITGQMRQGRGVDGPQIVAFSAQGRVLEEDYRRLRNSLAERPASTLLSDILISLLPFLIIIGLLYFLFIRQLRSAGRGAMSFGKSKAKMLTRDRERITFKDVAGCDEAKQEVSEIVDFLRDPKRFQVIGGKIPKGVLMVGPPGTGKTLLAKAVAGEADVPFFTISGSDFVEMFVGVGAARVRDMFEQGRKNAPCLIFIDEIDAVGRQRGAGLGGGNDEREQTLNSLLVEMDGFDGHEGIIIIAATNRPDVLDSALLRPGRFDRQVVIDLPDLNGRHEILQVHAKKIKLAETVDLALVARNASGFSGADLANLLNEGALVAARYGKKAVDQEDINEARDKISYGRERRRLMDDEDKKITAWHEAGHAIVQAVVDDGSLPIHKVTIIPRGQSLGSTMFAPSKDFLNYSKTRLENQICCAMGGRIAEDMTFSEITSGASGDIKMATKMARAMVCDWGMSTLGPVALGENQDQVFLGREITRTQNYSENTAQRIDAEIKSIISQQYQRATQILEENKKSLDALAEALLKFETLDGKHVHEILEQGDIVSPVVKRDPPPPRDQKLEEEEEKIRQADSDGKDGPDAETSPANAPA